MNTIPVEPLSTPSLYIRDGDLRRTVSLDRSPFTIGRAPESQLIFTQEFISRRQAEITFEDGKFIIRDLGARCLMYRLINATSWKRATRVTIMHASVFSIFVIRHTRALLH